MAGIGRYQGGARINKVALKHHKITRAVAAALVVFQHGRFRSQQV